MTAKLVDSGKLDISVELHQLERLDKSLSPYNLPDLLAHLHSTHSIDYVYRGQIKNWPGPLVPSIYRGRISSKVSEVPFTKRLREEGRVFHKVTTAKPSKSNEKYHRRIRFNQYLGQVFGYPFGSILAQQCGITSEGLDVTHHPDVAAFFAIFDFETKKFINEGEGVIYRFRAPDASPDQMDIRKANFFDCPSVVSAWVIFNQLRSVNSWEESVSSFITYQSKLPFIENGLRPLNLLALPKKELASCRVVQQYASLLLPDMVLPTYYKEGNIKPPIGKAEWDGPLLIEDLSARDGVEEFRFRHSPQDKFYVPIAPRELFPKNDGVTKILKAYFAGGAKMTYMTEKGIVEFPYYDEDLIQ